MESSSFIDGLLQEETAAARVKNTEKLGAEFPRALTNSVTQYIREAVTPSVSEETIEGEGIGLLDPQARKTIARRWLRHQPTHAQQLRSGESKVYGPSAHAAERAVIHVVDVVGVTDLNSQVQEQRRTAVAEWLGGVLAEGTLSIEPENGEQQPIRIQEVNAVLHLVERNAFGQITSHEYPLGGQSAGDDMQAAYATSSTRILQSDKEVPSTTRGIGLLVLGSEIAESIAAVPEAKTVAIPLYLSKELANEYPGRYIAASLKEPQVSGGRKK